jgi:cyclopropane fatty-acyl-phospholipid synthase-like methyltransferase
VAEFDKFYGQDGKGLYYPKPSSILRKNVEKLVFKDAVALDLGCGDGRNSFYLAEQGITVHCYDISNVAISKINRLNDRFGYDIRAIHADVTTLEFPANSYDLIVASTILDHFEEHTALNVLERIKTWIKPGGYVYVGVFTKDDPAYKDKAGLLPDSDKDKISETGDLIRYFFTVGELKLEFQSFSVLEYYEGLKEDLTHGNPHFHGLARIFCQKPVDAV